MKITNKSKVTQVFGGIEIAPGGTHGERPHKEEKPATKEKPKRGRPKKDG